MKLECGHDSTQNDPELNDVTNIFQRCAAQLVPPHLDAASEGTMDTRARHALQAGS